MNKIIIAGLGPGDKGSLSLAAFEALKKSKHLYLRTEKHPTVDYLTQEGISFEALDFFYDKGESFDQVYREIADFVIEKAKEHGEITYGVPGHPLVAEKTVELLKKAENEELKIEIIGAVSFIDAVITALNIDPVSGLKIVDGLSIDKQKPDPTCGNIITQVYDRMVASDVKLQLMNIYKDEYEIFVIKGAGIPGIERIEKIPLYLLDHLDWVDYLTSLYLPPALAHETYRSFGDLVAIMEELRGPEGCPWDRKQTRRTLRPYLLEETCEVLEAIDKDDLELLVEELGDLLLQVVFHAQIGKEDGEFEIKDITDGIVNKLIIRHPHVFGDVEVTNESGALASWEKSKRDQKGIDNYTDMIKAIPKTLPELMRSYKVQQKAALSGFDWENIDGPLVKLEEEIKEFDEAVRSGVTLDIEGEAGDLLFTMVNVCRFYKIQPELALKATTEKFIKRFEYIEQKVLQIGKKLDKMNLKEMDVLWEEAKTLGL